MKDYHEQNYYELLDVTADADQEAILNAYKKARATYSNHSPALYSLFNKDEAEELLKLIDEAYAVLSNQYKRKEYDKKKSGVQIMDPPPIVQRKETPVSTTNAAEAQKEFEKNFTQVQGFRGVVIKNNPNAKNPPGITRFGRYTVDDKFETEISEAQVFSGPYLQKIRLYKNINLDQISDFSKISRAYLTAIEASDYTCLPVVVFLRGFLIQLAKALELDPTRVTASYLRLMNEEKKK